MDLIFEFLYLYDATVWRNERIGYIGYHFFYAEGEFVFENE